MGMETAMKNNFRRDIPYALSFPELIELQQFGAIRDEIVNQVITGDKTPQQGLEEITNEYKRLGGDKQDQLMQEWYDKNKAELAGVKYIKEE